MTLHENVLLTMSAAVPLHVRVVTPESASLTAPLTDNCAVLNTLPSAGEETLKVGDVLSRLIVALAVALLLDVSVTVPVTCWFEPSVLTMMGEGQL